MRDPRPLYQIIPPKRNVFLNVPYDEEWFLPFEIAYWSTLTAFGLNPVQASDVRERGWPRVIVKRIKGKRPRYRPFCVRKKRPNK